MAVTHRPVSEKRRETAEKVRGRFTSAGGGRAMADPAGPPRPASAVVPLKKTCPRRGRWDRRRGQGLLSAFRLGSAAELPMTRIGHEVAGVRVERPVFGGAVPVPCGRPRCRAVVDRCSIARTGNKPTDMDTRIPAAPMMPALAMVTAVSMVPVMTLVAVIPAGGSRRRAGGHKNRSSNSCGNGGCFRDFLKHIHTPLIIFPKPLCTASMTGPSSNDLDFNNQHQYDL